MCTEEEFLRNEAECRRMAEAAQDQREERQWLKLAEMWMRMSRSNADATSVEPDNGVEQVVAGYV